MSQLRVSDRALLGFLGQAGGVDVEQIREQLAASLRRAHEAAERMGGGNYIVASGKRSFVVRNGVVVQLLSRTSRSGRLRHLKRPAERP